MPEIGDVFIFFIYILYNKMPELGNLPYLFPFKLIFYAFCDIIIDVADSYNLSTLIV
jgi:hypothetical protein